MSEAPNLLNDDGSASIATALMMSHHAFRRDLSRLTRALEKIEAADASRIEALREEWRFLHGALHGHHQSEDNGVFPGIAAEHASVRATIEKLTADHGRIDPVLERGDSAFAELPNTRAALAVCRELQDLLHPHLAAEEAEIVPFLRHMNVFPPPPNDETAAMYAEGFAWSMHGIAPEVLAALDAMLPENIKSKLPAARAAFDARCQRAWGSAKAGAAKTPIPDTTDGG